jgi:hypothetical protein
MPSIASECTTDNKKIKPRRRRDYIPEKEFLLGDLPRKF